VDDDDVVLGVGRMMLEKLGFEVVTAADGFEAVSVFKRHSPQWRLVVLDLSMPRMDGEDAFRAIRNIRADIPVLLSSGYTEEHVALRFSEPAPAGFLHKPYRLSALSETIRQVLSAAEGCGIDSGR
jgi:two-component system, cell cycle sensor histidine kinase and response regulator CckA